MAMKRGRPSNKRPVVEPIRRKCQAPGCGKIRLVVYREWKIPPRTQYGGPQTPREGQTRLDIPGAEVNYYCCFPNLDDGTFACENNA